MPALIAAVLPLVLQIVGLILNKWVKDEEARKHFVSLVSALEFGGLKSVGLNKSYRDQIDAHKQRVQTKEDSTSKR